MLLNILWLVKSPLMIKHVGWLEMAQTIHQYMGIWGVTSINQSIKWHDPLTNISLPQPSSSPFDSLFWTILENFCVARKHDIILRISSAFQNPWMTPKVLPLKLRSWPSRSSSPKGHIKWPSSSPLCGSKLPVFLWWMLAKLTLQLKGGERWVIGLIRLSVSTASRTYEL